MVIFLDRTYYQSIPNFDNPFLSLIKDENFSLLFIRREKSKLGIRAYDYQKFSSSLRVESKQELHNKIQSDYI
jgi:hypothetical protein